MRAQLILLITACCSPRWFWGTRAAYYAEELAKGAIVYSEDGVPMPVSFAGGAAPQQYAPAPVQPQQFAQQQYGAPQAYVSVPQFQAGEPQPYLPQQLPYAVQQQQQYAPQMAPPQGQYYGQAMPMGYAPSAGGGGGGGAPLYAAKY